MNGPLSSLEKAMMALAAVALGVSFWFTPETLPSTIVCGFRQMSGLPCPGCGLTRSVCSISHGHFGAAWEFNPFGYVFYVAMVLTLLWPLLIRRIPGLNSFVATSRLGTVLPIMLVAAMVIYGVARMFSTHA